MGKMLSTPSPAPAARVRCMRAGSSSQVVLSVKEKVRITAAAPSRQTLEHKSSAEPSTNVELHTWINMTVFPYSRVACVPEVQFECCQM